MFFAGAVPAPGQLRHRVSETLSQGKMMVWITVNECISVPMLLIQRKGARLIKSTCTEDAVKTGHLLWLQTTFPRKEEEEGKTEKNPTPQIMNKTQLFRAIT